MKIILEAIVGSTAYGLATENSDIDKIGVYVVPTSEILSIHKPKETIVMNKPDITYHEVEKYVRLAMNCNPTILELLFMDKYEKITDEGRLLITIRHSFLNTTIYNSYGGYAIQQARKLNRRGHSFSSETKNRSEKHARHCYRLLKQGSQLLREQNLSVRVDDPQEIMDFGKLEVEDMVNKFEEEYKKFRAIETRLPKEANYKVINDTLLKIRDMNV
jgi:hypothetical protein